MGRISARCGHGSRRRPDPRPSPTSGRNRRRVSRPRWRRPVTSSTSVARKKLSTASATKPRYQAPRAASMRASRVAPVGLPAEALVGLGERRAGEQRARCGHLAAGQEHGGGRFPLRLEQRPHAFDRRGDARHDMDAVARVADGEGQDVARIPRCPSRAAAGTRRRTRRAPPPAAGRSPGSGRCRARGIFPASRPAARRPGRRSRAASGARGVQDDRRVAAGAVQMRLGDLQREAVATAASNALPPRSSTAMPTWLASQCVLATTPNVPAISGRVVNMAATPRCVAAQASAMVRAASMREMQDAGAGGRAERGRQGHVAERGAGVWRAMRASVSPAASSPGRRIRTARSTKR